MLKRSGSVGQRVVGLLGRIQMTSSLGGEWMEVAVEGVTGNEGPKMVLDVCQDLVGSTNAADWPHEDVVVQNARGTARPSKSEKKSAWFFGSWFWCC